MADELTCPTCNPFNVRGPNGELIPGPGILRAFGDQAVICPTCLGTGYIGTPDSIRPSSLPEDGGNPNWIGQRIPLLPISSRFRRIPGPAPRNSSIITAAAVMMLPSASMAVQPAGAHAFAKSAAAVIATSPSATMTVRRTGGIAASALLTMVPATSVRKSLRVTGSALLTQTPAASALPAPAAPLVQVAQIKQGTPTASLTLAYPYNVGPGSVGFRQPITPGNSLFLYVFGDGPADMNLASVSGGGAQAWAYPLGAAKAMYGRNVAGSGRDPISFTTTAAQTFAGLLAEFSGSTTVEPFTDDYASGSGPATPSLTPQSVPVTMIAVFQINGTGKTISNPTNGFVFYPPAYVDDGIRGIVMTYRIDTVIGTPINTGITVTP